MPIRSRSQRTGSEAEGIVRQLIDSHPNWLARSQDHDFGVDLEGELADSAGAGHQRLRGKLIKIQVKGSEEARRTRTGVSVTLGRDYLEYVEQFRLPVILVIVDTSTREVWWTWLQEWLVLNERRVAGSSSKSFAVHVKFSQTLLNGLGCRLAMIASGQDPLCLILALRELSVTARLANNVDVVDGIFDLLEKVDDPSRAWALEKTIDALVGLGPRAGFWLTQQYVPQLIAIVGRIGGAFTQDQVVRLVNRGDTYSRTAIYALAKLYDDWGEHAVTLALPQKFNELGLDAVGWYCAMREAYPMFRSFELWGKLGSGALPTAFGDMWIADDEEVRWQIYSRWPNVGDSVFLDFLVAT